MLIVFVLPASGTASRFFARRQIEFFEDDLWVNQTSKYDFQKRFPVMKIDSMCQAAIFCRGSAKSENSESSQVDWKRETTCNLIPRLENLQNHS